MSVSMEPPTRTWVHRSGDRYVVAAGQIVGNVEHSSVAYDISDDEFVSIDAAVMWGWTLYGHDDFSIAAIRDGKLHARLWMHEVVDDEPGELIELAAALGIEVRS